MPGDRAPPPSEFASESPSATPDIPRSQSRPPGHWLATLSRWIDNEAGELAADDADRGVDWLRTVPFVAMHLACLAVFWVGFSATALIVAIGLYALRMFAITGFYHRYFSHKAFHTSRAAQFLFAVLAASAVQRGPMWWASQHRHHHAHADEEVDVHSPVRHGFLWSHMGWFLCRANFRTRLELVKDWARFPELRFLDRFDAVVPAVLGIGLFLLGEILENTLPELGTDGPQLLVWGFAISTIVLYHATFTVNSLAHVWGRRRYATRDTSRNNPWLALITFGEGWHNNHHHYPSSARQGFYWWEFDPTYYLLRLLAWCRIVWNLKPLPAGVREARREARVPVPSRRDA
jgi:stearoyl-CoA desaturase (delta-9 desaturase)